MTTKPRIAVVGASGVVGAAMLSILAEQGHREDRVTALASERSVGQDAEFGDIALEIQPLSGFDFSSVDYALFAAAAAVSAQYAPLAAAAGTVVIDNSDAFRDDDTVPLVVTEVNAHLLDGLAGGCIVASPGSAATQLALALAPLHRAAGIARINVATYESVSGAGRQGLQELATQTAQRLNFREPEMTAFAQPIAFNLLPQIGGLTDNGYSREEMALLRELRRVLADAALLVNATAVRVPVFYGLGAAVHCETRDEIGIDRVRELLLQSPGVAMLTADDDGTQPTPVTHASGSNLVYVGRLRRDLSHPRGIDLWVVADNVRKGAALNSIQIMNCLERRRLAVGKRPQVAVHSAAKGRSKTALPEP
jgi:aspartate-semialdehyde dehydrogenase